MGNHNFRGEFKAQLRITTTLSTELQKLAHSKAIKWSEALEVGVKKLAFMEVKDISYGETIEVETEANKTAQLQRAIAQMQEHINVLEQKRS